MNKIRSDVRRVASKKVAYRIAAGCSKKTIAAMIATLIPDSLYIHKKTTSPIRPYNKAHSMYRRKSTCSREVGGFEDGQR
jgi:hypothetical protein